MTPTNRLRWIERENFVSTDEYDQMLPVGMVRRVVDRVLQQWFNDTSPSGGPDVGKWRDVPLEAE